MKARQMIEADLYAGLTVKCLGPHCNRSDALWYHQRTAFVHEESNWIALCPPCREDNDEYWNGMWADYYADCL
jgi:hypothetical protein